MFKEIYRSANNDIKADDELLNKVLKQKRRKRTPIYKYSSIAAAVVIISAAIASIPLMNRDNSGIIYEEASISTAAPSGAASGTGKTSKQQAAIESTSKPNSEASTAKPQKAENIQPQTGTQSAAASRQSGASEKSSSSDTSERKVTGENPSQIAESVDNTAKMPETARADIVAAEYYPQTDADKKTEYNTDSYEASDDEETQEVSEYVSESVNTYTKSVVLHVNSEDYGSDYGAVSGTYENYDTSDPCEAVDWSMEDYFNYLGENIFDKITLEPDFEYIGDYEMTVSVNERGEPGFDNRIFPYKGSSGRYVTVITSKNKLTAQSYLTDERYVKSDIAGNPAVIIGSEENYKCYIIENGISYIITASGVNEEELENLLVSIGG